MSEQAHEAEWWADKCESEAVHYEALQREYYSDAENFSPEREREIFRKSPQTLYETADRLKNIARKLKEAQSLIDKILSRVDKTKEEAKKESKNILNKISDAIDLMDGYSRVKF